MSEILTMDCGLKRKLESALCLAKTTYPNERQLIDKRLLSIRPVYYPIKAGVLINNREGYPVVGDYRILASRSRMLTLKELAKRICAVAIILEMEQEIARPTSPWLLLEEEIETNAEKYIAAFAEVSAERATMTVRPKF